jgi:Integrase core domain
VLAPRANAFAERWVGTVRRELLDRMLIFGRRQLEAALVGYVAHYNEHRPHRALGQASPLGAVPPTAPTTDTRIVRVDRVGGLIPRVCPGRMTWMRFRHPQASATCRLEGNPTMQSGPAERAPSRISAA